MTFKHNFRLDLHWSNKDTRENLVKNSANAKNHKIVIAGKEELHVSAAKAFKGDPNLYNPEDLLLSSLTSCHMMSYLYVCQQNKIQVHSYTDQAEAFLEVSSDGSGRIVKVVLRPVVTISKTNNIDIALGLHQEAAKLCFIANSCNFEIEHFPEVLIAED